MLLACVYFINKEIEAHKGDLDESEYHSWCMIQLRPGTYAKSQSNALLLTPRWLSRLHDRVTQRSSKASTIGIWMSYSTFPL